ncbi:MAG: hypothetical protein AB1896_15945, partial [Thermodesulfobacteriota bacterium]
MKPNNHLLLAAAFLAAFISSIMLKPTSAAETGLPVVQKVTVLLESGGRVDWDRSGSNRLTVDRAGPDGYFDV